jgi:membrane protease YdiL (CAAX protease family)
MPLVIAQRQQAYGIFDISLALLRFIVLVLLAFFCLSGFLKIMAGVLPAHWLKPSWAFGYLTHGAMLLVALGFIAVLKSSSEMSFGLNWPKGKTYFWPALWIGGLGGLVMLVVDHYPDLLAHRSPAGPYSTALGNMIPWLIMQGTLVGVSEEIVFRSLFLGYLIVRLGRKFSIGPFDISAAGVLIAVVFSLAHASSFWSMPFAAAFGQQVYAIGYGLLGAYLFEQSGSVLAPIIAHDAGDLVEWGCRFTLSAAWSN